MQDVNMRSKPWVYVSLLGMLSAFVPVAQAGLFSLSEQDEVAIGRQAAAKVEQQVKLLPDWDARQYVSQLGMQLARLSTRPNLPWRFRVIDDSQINAFALPGGFIYVHSRVLQVARSEAELAAVLAHEIGHIEGRHHKEKIEQAMRYQLGLGVLGVALGHGGGSDAAMIAGRLLAEGELTRYSREAESDADKRGVALLYRAGFDPMAMSRFLERLVELEGNHANVSGGFFADHPSASRRVAATRQLAAGYKAQQWRSDNLAFQRMSRRMHGFGGGWQGMQGQRLHPKPGAHISRPGMSESLPGDRINRSKP